MQYSIDSKDRISNKKQVTAGCITLQITMFITSYAVSSKYIKVYIYIYIYIFIFADYIDVLIYSQ